MKGIINRLVIASSALLLFGASDLTAQESFNLTAINATDMKAAIETGRTDAVYPAKQSVPSVADNRKEWTIMIFMNAKNDLAQSTMFGLAGNWAEKDIAEMKKVGTTDKVNVVVEYGATGKGSKRMLLGKTGIFSSGEEVYNEEPNADMGDYKRVIEFAKWAKTYFPAKKYMFVLWNHGSGWIDPVIKSQPADTDSSGKGILFDNETKNYVRTRQLGEILKQTGYVDVFVMSACLMQMAEVAYEVKDNAGLIVASEELMLTYGFDYEKLLTFMNANTGADDCQISDFFINWQRQFFAEGASVGTVHLPLDSMAATISTLRPAALNYLPGYLDAFAGAAMRNKETGAVKAAVADVIRFNSLDPKGDKKKMTSVYADLYDFVRITGANARSPETRRAADRLMSFIKSELVIRSIGINYDAENGYDYSTVGGIAINMTMKTRSPATQLTGISETRYSDLALSKASLWDEFVTWTDGIWRK